MRGIINDCLRSVIGWTITVAGLQLSGCHRLRTLFFRLNQKRLKRKYRITSDTPVSPCSSPSLQYAAGKTVRFAETSGSTGAPKRIPYTKRRLLALKLTFSDMFARACCAFRIKRTSLYVFSSFETDASLTSLLLDENRLPNYLSTLQAPYRLQHHPSIRALVSEYGAAAIRLWILAISNPGVLYSTNPSTISTFLDELANNWTRSSKLVRDWCKDCTTFDSDVHRIALRLRSRHCAQRLTRIATSDVPLPLSVCAPAVAAYICWTGGYVKPFLDRLGTQLPPSRYKLIPMYSMSTETVETLPYFRGEDITFFPIAPGVFYEFSDDSQNLLDAEQLEPGKLYAMVVSDAYGLRRYQTDDLFLCRRKVIGLPDLVFLRRRTLEYSFTGEKLTAEQLSAVFQKLREMYPVLTAEKFLTCVPSQPANALPHYQMLVIGDQHTQSAHELLAACCDELLCEMNCEYRSKRASGRLGPVRSMNLGTREFAQAIAEAKWETQFKFLPLTLHPLPSNFVTRVS
jgi:hypothetical protein